MKLLFQLYFRQKWHEFKFAKLGFAAYVYFFYCGAIALMFSGWDFTIPDAFIPATLLGSCMFVALPDFLFKLFMCHSATVMDSFLKTRPISRRDWNWFLVLSQFFNSSNLFFPIVLITIFFHIMSMGDTVLMFVCLYLLSVMTGIAAMIIKKKSNYVDEMSGLKIDKKKPTSTSNPIFALQYKSILRSKRLMFMMLFPAAYILFMLMNPMYTDPNNSFCLVMIAMATYFVPVMFGQWGMAIEANFFNAIWTKPIPLAKIVTDKFHMLGILSTIGMSEVLLMMALGFVTKEFLIHTLCLYLFSLGYGNLTILYDTYKCKPFDLFGSVFFNYQGNSNAYKVSRFISIISSFAIIFLIYYIFSDYSVVANILIAAIGIGCLLVRKRFISSVEKRFLKDKYTYMEKYNKK